MNTKIDEKLTNHNSNFEPLSNSRSWQDYLDPDAFMLFPANDEWRKRFGYTMYLWALKESSLEIMQFCIEYKYAYMTIKEWVNKYPDLEKMYNDVKLVLASRRRIGALTKKFDKDVVYKDMHKYDPEYLEINRYWMDLKRIEEMVKNEPFNLIIQQAKDTGLVKPRSTDDKLPDKDV